MLLSTLAVAAAADSASSFTVKHDSYSLMGQFFSDRRQQSLLSGHRSCHGSARDSVVGKTRTVTLIEDILHVCSENVGALGWRERPRNINQSQRAAVVM